MESIPGLFFSWLKWPTQIAVSSPASSFLGPVHGVRGEVSRPEDTGVLQVPYINCTAEIFLFQFYMPLKQ